VVVRRLLLSLACVGAVLVGVQPVLAAVDARSAGVTDAPFVQGGPHAPIQPVTLSLGAAAIGSVRTGSVALPAGSFRLRGTVGGSALLARRLALEVVAGGKMVYSGSLSGFREVRIEGGQRLVLRVGLPSTGSDAGDNPLQGLAAYASFSLA
jgi:hypothetical protein